MPTDSNSNIISRESDSYYLTSDELSSIIESVAALRVSISSFEARPTEIQHTPHEDSASSENEITSDLRPFSVDIQEAYRISETPAPPALVVQAQSVPENSVSSVELPTATPVPQSKWGFFVGDIVRIRNSIRIGNIRVPYRYKTGTIVRFTAQNIIVEITYENSGVLTTQEVIRGHKAVKLVTRYNVEQQQS